MRKWQAALVLLFGTFPPALLYLMLEHKFRVHSNQLWTAASPICFALTLKTGTLAVFTAVLILIRKPTAKARTSLTVCLTIYVLDYILHLAMVVWLRRLKL